MRANYGYHDGSGDFFITIETDLCDGCGECVTVCPAGVLELVEDEFTIEDDSKTIAVADEHVKKIKYSCAPCKPSSGYAMAELPCMRACAPNAIQHSW